MKKRFFAAFMSVVMMLSLLPASVIPADAAGEQTSATQDTISMYLFNYNENVNAKNSEGVLTGGTDALPLRFSNGEYAEDNPSATIPGGDFVPTMDPNLVNGFPEVEGWSVLYQEDGKTLVPNYNNTGSLKYLFDPALSNTNYMTVHPVQNVQLFDYNDQTKLYSYDSAKNAAYLNGSTLEIYDYALRPFSSATRYAGQGHFLPFNQKDNTSIQVTDGSGNILTKPTVAEGQTDLYARLTWPAANLNEDTYALSGIEPNVYSLNPETSTDLWFGMYMEFDFAMPANAKIGNDDMVFDFQGDDDVFVYIDDKLVLNIGGTHGATRGNINFATGAVNVYQMDSLTATASTTTLKELFNLSGTTFDSYSTHTLKFFYLERGGSSANCRLNFNMLLVPKGNLTVEKQEANLNDAFKGQQEYTFKLTDENHAAMGGKHYAVMEGINKVDEGNTTDEGLFFLKGGQKAVFTDLTKDDECYVNEVIPEGAQYTANQQPTGLLDLANEQNVVFTNNWNTTDLVIRKDVTTGDGRILPEHYADIEYSFNLALSNTAFSGVNFSKSFALKDNGTETIQNVPYGTQFSLTENEPNSHTIYTYGKPSYNLNSAESGTPVDFESPFTGTVLAQAQNTIALTNSLSPAAASLTVSKTVTGVNEDYINVPEFTFKIEKVGEPSNSVLSNQAFTVNGVSKQTNEAGEFKLKHNESAVFNLDVLEQYKVTETSTGSYTPDSQEKTVSLAAGNDKNSQTVTFTNTYSATGTLNGAEKLKVTKELDGREWTADDSFTFTLTGEPGAPMPAESERTVTISGTETHTGNFGDIHYTAMDIGKTYEYTITEDPTTIAGIANNATAYKVFVEISDDDGNDPLKVNTTYEKDNKPYSYGANGLEFTNTYNATGTLNGLAVSKTIDKRDIWVNSDEFEFTLYEGQSVIETITIDSETRNHTKEFAAINYTLADVGTHTYTIKETSSPAGVGITADNTVYTVTVNVSDNGNGTLAVEATYGDYDYENEDSFKFVNKYASTGELGAAKLKVAKEIQNRTEWVKSDEFEFTLFDKDGVALDTITIKKGDSDHSKCFDSINYTLADVGTHTYTIRETSSPADVGITADNAVYTVTVKVSDDNSNGTLVVEPTYKKGTATYTYNDTDGMVFTNVYKADGKLIGAEDLVVTKTINDRADDAWVESDSYTFTLTGKDNAPMPAVTQITIGKDTENHTANFGDIAFDESDIGKTYEYTITETAKDGRGITTDTTVYTVLVTVEDNGDGTLDVKATYQEGDQTYTEETMVFTNEYDATGTLDGSKNLKVTKTLTGRSWQETDAFYVEITPKDSDSPMPAGDAVLTFTNTDVAKDSVSAAFGDIAYTEKDIGTHVYEVKEVYGYLTDYGQISRITYDTTVYTVSVTVTDKYDGTLDVTASYVSNRGGWFAKDEAYTYGDDGLTFVNRYTKPSKPSTDTDIEDDIPLNTEDHYAYIIGYPDGEVKPDDDITRAEVATIFFRLLTDEARDLYWSTENEYPDVKETQWFNNAISTLTNAGIINGYNDGTFRPNEPITRAEFAKIAVSFFSYVDKEYQGLYPDVPANKWYALFVEAASELGLIEGYPDGTFRPNEDITRAEACTIVNRTIQRKPHEDQLHKDMIVWPDNPAPGEDGHMWYYEQVQEATNSHDYDFKDEYESWTEILENRDWAALEKAWADSNDAPGGEVMK